MHEYTSTLRIWELTCPGHPREVGRLRRWTRELLAGTPCVEDAALIVTELGTNALRHSASGTGRCGAFHLTVVVSADTVAVAVTDTGGSRTAPHIAKPDEDDTTGRGLSLVNALADRVRTGGNGRQGHTVTAEFDLHPAPAQKPDHAPVPGAAPC